MSYQKPVLIDKIGTVVFKIPEGYSVENEIDWLPKNDRWSVSFVHFKKHNSQPLAKGKYYTQFSHQFNFETLETELLTFKINFEIK